MSIINSDGFFKSDKLKPGDASDGDSYKVRRRQSGGCRDYLSDEQNANIDSLVRDRLNPVCGYRRNAGCQLLPASLFALSCGGGIVLCTRTIGCNRLKLYSAPPTRNQ